MANAHRTSQEMGLPISPTYSRTQYGLDRAAATFDQDIKGLRRTRIGVFVLAARRLAEKISNTDTEISEK